MTARYVVVATARLGALIEPRRLDDANCWRVRVADDEEAMRLRATRRVQEERDPPIMPNERHRLIAGAWWYEARGTKRIARRAS